MFVLIYAKRREREKEREGRRKYGISQMRNIKNLLSSSLYIAFVVNSSQKYFIFKIFQISHILPKREY